MDATIKIKRDVSSGDIPFPSYATIGSAGLDLRAAESAEIGPLERAAIGTGIYLEIPPSLEGQVRPRSGLALKHGVTVLNSPGTIDSDYRGEIRVIMVNLGKETYSVKRGERIAQIVFSPCVKVNLEESENISDSIRGTGGFGSTGVG
jgi:dUTP pyrophosphatase